MSQNIEIEFKNLLTKEEFLRLINYFQLGDHDFQKQENHYFETPDFSLKKQKSALRIRHKNNRYEMTLKQPHKVGILETNQTLSQSEAEKIFNTGNIIDGAVKDQLEFANISINELQYFGSLTTERAKIEYKNGILFFDHSSYLNKQDFEVEYEVEDELIGKKVFDELLSSLQISIKHTDNKIRRFYNEKFKG